MPITQFDPKPVTVINNLTTNDSNKALSAAQGKYLYDSRYVHPTTSGNKHIPSGGSANQWLKYSADGTAAWAALPAASTSQAGIVQLSSSLTSSSETVAATSKAVQTLNNNLAGVFLNPNNSVNDMNNAPMGLSTYNPDTLNQPTLARSKYGSLYQWRVNRWTYQQACSTYGEIWFRRQINDAPWTIWYIIHLDQYSDNITGFDSTKISEVHAYYNRGTVQIDCTIKAGLTTGWHQTVSLGNIPEWLTPHQNVYGQYRINASADGGKYIQAMLSANYIQIYIGTVFSADIPMQFIYPAHLDQN